MNKLDRFKKQQALRASLSKKPILYVAPPPGDVDILLDMKIDTARLARFDYIGEISVPIEADPFTAQALLTELRSTFDKGKLDTLLDKAKMDLIKSVIGPLGLGKLVSDSDKVGGNVDTIHNARNNIYATEKAQRQYINRGKYDNDVSNAVHKHTNYIAHNKRHSINKKTIGAVDHYTNKLIDTNQRMDLDHVVSAKATHDDAGRVLANISTDALANIDENLTPTTASINRSKKQKSPEEFAKYLSDTAELRQSKISELQANKSLTDKDKKELNKHLELASVDPNALKTKGKKAQNAQDTEINSAYYTGDQFRDQLTKSSVKEGASMGAQQAIGVLLVELLTASMDEIKDAFKNGKNTDSIISDIKCRLGRIAKRVARKWDGAVKAFSKGFISGFISNIITVIINAFVTTSARFVRMIREGLFSLFQAFKIMLSPPNGLSNREAVHEGMKLIASGGILIGGILLEEVVEKYLNTIPVLNLIAGLLSSIIVGSITAILMAVVCYLIDKMDLLGAVKIRRDRFIIERLDAKIESSLERCEHFANEIDMLTNNSLLSET